MDDVARMIGYRPFPWMKWCWSFITPCVCIVRPTKHTHTQNNDFNNYRNKEEIKNDIQMFDTNKTMFSLVHHCRSVLNPDDTQNQQRQHDWWRWGSVLTPPPPLCRASSCSTWWTTSRWPTTTCTCTRGGARWLAGVWLCPPCSASPSASSTNSSEPRGRSERSVLTDRPSVDHWSVPCQDLSSVKSTQHVLDLCRFCEVSRMFTECEDIFLSPKTNCQKMFLFFMWKTEWDNFFLWNQTRSFFFPGEQNKWIIFQEMFYLLLRKKITWFNLEITLWHLIQFPKGKEILEKCFHPKFTRGRKIQFLQLWRQRNKSCNKRASACQNECDQQKCPDKTLVARFTKKTKRSWKKEKKDLML